MSTKPSLLIATPMYGGVCTLPFLESMLETYDWLGAEGIPVATYFIGNESLITRARNTCATLAMNKFDKLLFIDADVGWKTSDVSKLYYSDKKVIGGLYPHKCYPIKLNYNPMPNAIPNEKGECEVADIATGFLMIDCEVLRAMAPKVPTYVSTHMNGKAEIYVDFFQVGAGIFCEGQYESEDWYFSKLARREGFPCYVNTGILLTHTGTHTFRPEVK